MRVLDPYRASDSAVPALLQKIFKIALKGKRWPSLFAIPVKHTRFQEWILLA